MKSTTAATFDSVDETNAHIRRVNELLEGPINSLIDRAHVHDASKLLPPEKELFDSVTGKLKGMPGNPFSVKEVKQAYRDLWDAINGKGAWELNPWVWVIEFCRIETEKV